LTAIVMFNRRRAHRHGDRDGVVWFCRMDRLRRLSHLARCGAHSARSSARARTSQRVDRWHDTVATIDSAPGARVRGVAACSARGYATGAHAA
jgi:hypothetical protein